MLKRCAFATILTFFFSAQAYGQLLEDFESGSKISYASSSEDLETGTWYLDDTLLGTDDRDFKNGSQSARIRNNGFIRMDFDFPDGADYLQFYASNAGFTNDVGGALQAYVSTDGGSNWTEAGDEIELTSSLEEYNVSVTESGPVRFRIEKTAGGRVNVDDVYIEPHIEIEDDPTISIRRGNETIENESEIEFLTTSVGSSRSINFQITNNGEPDLNITDVSLQNENAFSIDSDITGLLGTSESKILTITFSPETIDTFTDQLTISSNDPETPDFTFDLTGDALSEEHITPIAGARELEFGTRVTVAGRVTVANEFEGPIFIQDETAGIAVYYEPIHPEVQRGDSVVVTGPVTEFNPTGSNPGDFLVQISAHDGDTDISYEIIDTEPVEVEPKVVTLTEMNEGELEAQLVTVNGVLFEEEGVFQGGTNYPITDNTDQGELRIDQNASDLVNASIPELPTDITGVIEQFAGIYQLKPRGSEDLDVDVYEPVGEDVPKDQTFDVVTWNIEWFGSSGNGPDDLDLQTNNVIEVVQTIDADLYALQEISNEQRFYALVDSLDEFSGFWADYSSQSQNTAYLFKTAVIDSVDSGLLQAGQQEYDWAFRLPLFFEFDATVNGETRRIFSYNVHAKAMGDEDSYDRRQLASLRLKTYLDNNRQDDNTIFIGDYNDYLTTSTFENQDSPYHNFISDENYFSATLFLEERGFNSYIAGQNRSMLDHITVSNELIEDHIDESQRVENPNYIGSYISTTSDHAPVWTRFDFTRSLVEIEDKLISENPDAFELNQNYPNPFNPTTNISFTLPERSEVTLRVYDVMGREVATLADNQAYNGGMHSLTFDASSLASGMYIYRLSLDNGLTLSRKMMIVK